MNRTFKSPGDFLSIPKDQGSVPWWHRPFFVSNLDSLTWHSRFCYSVWDHNNWFGGRRRGSVDGFRFLLWDSERTILSVNANVTDKNNANQPTHIHQQLTANEDYRMQFADHVHRQMVEGPLRAERAAARWLHLADDVRLAPASSTCSSIRCSHDGSQAEPASM